MADQGQEQQEQEQSLSDVVLDLEFEQKLVRTYLSTAAWSESGSPFVTFRREALLKMIWGV